MLTGLNHQIIFDNLSKTKKKLIVGGGLKNNEDLKKLKAQNSEFKIFAVIICAMQYNRVIPISKGIL